MSTFRYSPIRNIGGRRGACSCRAPSRRYFDAAYSLAVAAALVAAVAGCGGSSARVPVYPVQGKVEVNGQPAVGAVVVLHPRSNPAATAALAHVNPDGTFATTTYEPNDGAAEGDYVVTVEWFKPVLRNDDYVLGPNLAPEKYRRQETSDLVVHVASEATELPPIRLRR